MRYHRHFDPSQLRDDRFDFQVLADLESCLVVACRANPMSTAFPRHRHPGSTQVYYVLDGTMQLEVEGVTHLLGKDTAAVIPAGAAHSNSYPTAEREYHLDVLVPPPPRGGPLAEPVTEVPGESEAGAGPKPTIVACTEVEPFQPVPGFSASLMLAEEHAAGLNLVNATVAPSEEDSGVPWHIHEVDQLYFILDGELTVEVAGQSFIARKWDLVVLPAGVPHRNWNAGHGPERHVSFLVPAVSMNEGVDRLVEFSVKGSLLETGAAHTHLAETSS